MTSIERLNQIWNEAKMDIIAEIGENSYKTWISKIGIMDLDDGIIKLSAPSNFIRDNVNARYSDKLLNILNSYGCSASSINIQVYDGNNHEITDESSASTKPQPESNHLETYSQLDKKFTFENFVVGSTNEFAYNAALRVAESDTPAFNPLFLYGGVGLGKTHLMHSIAWHLKEHQCKKKVIYVSAEKFMYLFIKSLRFKDSMSFKELFRNVDVLMIDDVQFIGGKDTTQEEFFHTFNELINNNRQVILSADKSPYDLEGVEERLKSRFGWGVVADIHPTTYELRLGILQSKKNLLNVKVPNKVLEFLAMKITSNVRELEGALNRLVAHATLVGREITIDVVQEVLSDLLRSNEKFITIESIQKKVCEFYSVKLSDLTSSKRKKEIATARQIAMYLSKELTTKSLPEIGRNFGGKDHSTVIHAVKRVKENLDNDPAFRKDVEILRTTLES